MTKVKDALLQEYVFTYDALGRQLSQMRANSTMSYEYDEIGNRTKRTDYLGRETSYEYDNLNRLKKINYLQNFNGNPVQTPIHTASYNYDDLSRLTSATNEAGTVSFTYDNRSRIASTTDVFGHLINYGYDGNGNRTLLKFDNVNYATYVYDVANRLTSMTNSSDATNITFGYDNANRLTSRTYPNSINTTYEYDGMSRLTRLKDVSSTVTLFDRQLSYSTANQINQIVEPTQTRTFGYDNVDRLTSMTNGVANESYSFDAVGNRTSSHRSASYTYQANNKLTSTASATYNYDANGNLVSKAEGSNFWRYGWDYENRMTTASTRKQTVRYLYDALGRQVQRHLKGGREITKFIYDGLDVLVDDNSGTLTKYLNGAGIDNKLRVQTGSNVNYFLTDHLGSTNGLANNSGSLTASANYDSIGSATNANFPTRYQYTGREFDSFTGLHYYRNRWYDAQIGRFFSEDTIGFGGLI